MSLAKKYDARILIDDAHAVGVIGKNGRGTPSEFDLVDDVDLIRLRWRLRLFKGSKR